MADEIKKSEPMVKARIPAGGQPIFDETAGGFHEAKTDPKGIPLPSDPFDIPASRFAAHGALLEKA